MSDINMSVMNLKLKTPFLGKFSYCILTGVLGTLVLAMFISVFMELYRVVRLMPWIIAFNAAITGYSLMDKTGDALQHKHMASIAAGIVNVMITGMLLTILSYYFFYENIFTTWNFSLFLLIGAVCSELGALLAIKYFKLSDKTTRRIQ